MESLAVAHSFKKRSGCHLDAGIFFFFNGGVPAVPGSGWMRAMPGKRGWWADGFVMVGRFGAQARHVEQASVLSLSTQSELDAVLSYVMSLKQEVALPLCERVRADFHAHAMHPPPPHTHNE